MKDELITFETAKLAKEKGFNIPTLHYYRGDGDFVNPWMDVIVKSYHILNHNKSIESYFYSAPTQSLLQRWLRDVHKIYLVPTVDIESRKYSWEIYNFNTSKQESGEWEKYNTYEEALEAGLQHALKLIK
jgi:hypothetical protein